MSDTHFSADRENETWPLFEYDHDRAMLPKSIVSHPVVGFGLGCDPAIKARVGVHSRGSAFVWIAARREVEWRASKDNPYFLALRAGTVLRENPAVVWGWTTKFTRKFINAVAESGLIDAQLHQALLDCTNDRMWRKKREPLPTRKRDAVLRKTSGKCAYCAVALTAKPGHPHSYCVDHVLAVRNGGTDDVANLIPSCRDCNAKKSAKTALRFMTDNTNGDPDATGS